MAELSKLISGRSLTYSVVWNFGGMAAPMLVALVSIPLLIEGMGKERFGLLAIIWMGVGYFSLFDMGLGRALVKLVAERLGNGNTTELGLLIWTALHLILILGVVGGTLLGIGASTFVSYLLNVGGELQVEAVTAMRLLAVGLPAVVVTSALVGLLEAHQRFSTIAAVRMPLGILTFVGPLITLQLTPSLVWATTVLLSGRVLAFLAFFFAAATVRPELKRPGWPCRKHIGPLLHFGGWLTVTNIVGPLMVYFDRFFVGAIMNMTAVTYYVTPCEIISRVQFFPRSVVNVLFPALTTAITADRDRFVSLYSRSNRILFLLMLPVMSGLFLLGPEALQLWLGSDFREIATPVVQWLALGWLINTLARMPYTVLQSAGRPDLVAKTHLLELVPYILALWIFTTKFGIAGTAAAWFMRALSDAVILNFLTHSRFPELAAVVRQTQILVIGLLGGFFLAWWVDSLLLRELLFVAVIVMSSILLWPSFKLFLKTNSAKNNRISPFV